MNLLNQVFHEYLDFGVVAFTDDMLVYSTNRVEHERHLVSVSEVLEKKNYSSSSWDVSFGLEKCHSWFM
jgi:hypothetical protein